jgi:hypothetical protein
MEPSCGYEDDLSWPVAAFSYAIFAASGIFANLKAFAVTLGHGQHVRYGS